MYILQANPKVGIISESITVILPVLIEVRGRLSLLDHCPAASFNIHFAQGTNWVKSFKTKGSIIITVTKFKILVCTPVRNVRHIVLKGILYREITMLDVEIITYEKVLKSIKQEKCF